MRLRRKPGTKEALLALVPPLVLEPQDNLGKWQRYFGNTNPIYIELGTGKGRFITTLAQNNPHINYIGLELKEEVLLMGVKKAVEQNLNNIAFIWGNVQELDNYFAPEELARIYINFCDPWPKKRWAKRRLTHRTFLANYRKLLNDQGQIHFKTDNKDLFEFSLNEFVDDKWQLQNITLDLYKNPPEDNIATEYELKFKEKGMPIYRLEALKE
ncbi:MAG: tRNA (guanosine(46)-N7)-methyltransferase TrmB [Clostridia bacterium]|jgi:tRNA (guanine-N7-)-methyltransferase|nr:tRNA (guanosine(46)-N7)-methyltransferase TrmB [Clostridia bacterium]